MQYTTKNIMFPIDSNIPTLEQTQSQRILIQPSFNLQFVCTQFQTTASLRILVVGRNQDNFQYKFHIKSTNRQDYKVIQSQGQLLPNVSKVIYFYLKQSAPINKNLKDKFLLIIKKSQHKAQGQGVWQQIFTRKFGIIIQSGLQKKTIQSVISPQVNSEMNNVSKFVWSVYSNPNTSDINRLYQPRSELRQTFLPAIPSTNTLIVSKYSNQGNVMSPPTRKASEILSKKSVNSIQNSQIEETQLKPSNLITQSKKSQAIKNSQLNLNNLTNYDPEKLQVMLMEEQKLKIELNSTIKQIENVKRKIVSIDSQNKSNKARGRFRIYFNIFIVIVAFFFGMWIKSLNIVNRVENFVGSVKDRFSFLGSDVSHNTTLNEAGL